MTGRGIHHVTIVSSDADRTCAFYGLLLGLRLVKRTVSHEDPGTYHLCFGDDRGRPGTLLTFFPWQRTSKGSRGACEAWKIVFRVPVASIPWWERRLAVTGVRSRMEESVFGEELLCFEDPDGTALALIGSDTGSPVWSRVDIPAEHSLSGVHDVVLKVREADPIGGIFREVLGFTGAERIGCSLRLVAHDGSGGMITLDEAKKASRGRMGAGSIHHAAFRARDRADEDAMVARLYQLYGIRTSVPKDRSYFRSVNFRSTCGMMMEIATDGPGFETDEAYETLGTDLKLPPALEERRIEIERFLPLLPQYSRRSLS